MSCFMYQDIENYSHRYTNNETIVTRCDYDETRGKAELDSAAIPRWSQYFESSK